MNKIVNFKHSNFASSGVSNLSLQKSCTVVQLTETNEMGTDFTKSYNILFNRVVESLLCSLHEHPVLLSKSYLLESQCF